MVSNDDPPSPPRGAATTSAHMSAASGALGGIPAVIAAVGRAMEQVAASSLAPGLYVVSTPIGNLSDVTLRALGVLARADVIYCEDTRHSQRLTRHYAIDRPLVPYHEHNAEQERPRILARLARLHVVALISDAGTPLISDPGYKLVRAARAEGHGVWCLPGASAPIAALSIAGLPTNQFSFEGFLPPRSAARRTQLETMTGMPGTLVFFEAPQRLAETLADMADVLGDRPAAVVRELTKIHEDVRLDRLRGLAAWAAAEAVKGEIVVLVGPAVAVEIDDARIQAELAALTALSVRDAARQVAETLGVPRSRVYQLALAAKRV